MDLKAKLRPFYVAKMLFEETDEDHYLTIAQIIDRLEKQYDITSTRGTISDDIKALQEFGIDIEVENSVQNRYYLVGRSFELPELKVLIDATESSRFITKEKSTELVKKLSALTSTYNNDKLRRNVDVENRIKADNEKIYYIMDALNEAINQRKKVSFQYFTYNVRKEQKLKYEGYTYRFSPYKLIWNGDYYYVVGYSDKHSGIGSFRIDRISKQPQILEEKAIPAPRNFDMNRYLNSMFRMYNGERKEIELVCDNDVMNSIIDKFGKDVRVLANDMQSFRVFTTTAIGPVFYSWIFGFNGKVKIKGPEDVREEYKKMVLEAANSFGRSMTDNS